MNAEDWLETIEAAVLMREENARYRMALEAIRGLQPTAATLGLLGDKYEDPFRTARRIAEMALDAEPRAPR